MKKKTSPQIGSENRLARKGACQSEEISAKDDVENIDQVISELREENQRLREKLEELEDKVQTNERYIQNGWTV